MEDFDLKSYIKDLDQQRKEGLLSNHEFIDSTRKLGFSLEDLANLGIDIIQEKLSPVIIRPYAGNKDFGSIVRFHDLFFRELFGRPKQEEDCEHEIPNIEKIIIETEGNVIGLAEFTREGPTSYGPAYEGSAYLEKLIISQKYRKLKLGSALLGEVVRIVSESQLAERLTLHATEEALSFYTACGFFTDYEVWTKEGVRMKRFDLPFDTAAYQKIREEIEDVDPDLSEVYEHRVMVSEYPPFLLEDKEFENNPFFALLRGKKDKVKTKIEYTNE
jgi:predicted GNAT family N-acyltransferase